MRRFWTAIFAIAVAVLGVAPAAAQADISSSSITSWVSATTDAQGHTTTISNGSYLISLDNPPNPTTLTVSGQTDGHSTDHVDVVCYFGTPTAPGTPNKILAANVPVRSDGTFSTASLASPPLLSSIAGHACRLRTVPTTGVSSNDRPQFAGPQVAVSEAALPSLSVGGHPYDFFVNAITFTGNAAWTSAGSTASCGPAVAPLDPQFDIGGNFAINCMGSLQGKNAPSGATRSEVQVDGQNAYDAASARGLIGSSVDLVSLPALTANVHQDPTSGLISTQSTEGWVVCPGPIAYPPTSSTCPHFATTGVQLERDIATSDGGDVVTMTDTWSSQDNKPHTLDLLYDDSVGATSLPTLRGYEFPSQTSFNPYGAGDSLPGGGSGPGSILVRSNVARPDGDPSEAIGAITYSRPPSDFRFISNGELAEHQAVQIPAGGSATLTYIYSTAFTIAQTQAMALAAQERLQPPAVTIDSPSSGATVSSPTVTLSGTAVAGSGVKSFAVGGQSVPVTPGGTWSAQVPLNPGANTITAVATDVAGFSAQAALTVVYQPPAPPPPPPPPLATCKVPRIKGMKLKAAEKALRRAHCGVGKIRHVNSGKLAGGRVMSSNPRAGRRLDAGHKVELFVSRGP